MIGYCAQDDTLFNEITVEEHLFLYASLRNLDPFQHISESNWLIKTLGLNEHRNKKAVILSGGTKRKLCLAISLIGAPQVILLDEPAAGVDP